VKSVADALGVARSNLIERRSNQMKRRKQYLIDTDAVLLAQIRTVVDARPTYGYRRVTALVNRELAAQGFPRVNHKRVYRVMRQAGLVFTKPVGRRSSRAHDGKVATLHSNTRWCSDGFEIRAWNGEIVRVLFAMDTCDRAILSWTASTAGHTGEMARDVMYSAVVNRFQSERAPKRIEWLTDNGSCYTADETITFGHALNLLPVFTPVRSPESNGMSESFVKTFKRDYVRCNALPDARTILESLDAWFKDYNNAHPHSALKMLSPYQFITNNLTQAA